MTNKGILRAIGGNIRSARLSVKMTQECLAELVGVHVQTIGSIEKGTYPFSVTTFVQISQYLDVSANRLLDGMPKPDVRRTTRILKAMARKRAPASRGKFELTRMVVPEAEIKKIRKKIVVTAVRRAGRGTVIEGEMTEKLKEAVLRSKESRTKSVQALSGSERKKKETSQKRGFNSRHPKMR